MITISEKVSIPTIDDIRLFDVVMRLDNFHIADMVRFNDPNTPETIALRNSISSVDAQLAALPVTTSQTNLNQRVQLNQQRDALRQQLQELLIPDYGMAIATLRYFAVDGTMEITLPINGLRDSFECFISDLESYSGEDSNYFMRAKKKMRSFIVSELANSSFMGFNLNSNYIITDGL